MALDLTKKVAVAKVVLEKKNVFGEKAQIVIATDISGSMSRRFSEGKVQELMTRILGIGMNMDDNQSIDVFAFDSSGHEIGDANERNIDGYVDNVFLRKVRVGGSTKYAPVMKMIVDKFGNVAQPQTSFSKLFGIKKTEPAKTNIPTLVFFITDGDNFDPSETEKIIRDSSDKPIFWQFVGIGGETDFQFLQKLDDLKGRVLDNADFFEVVDPTTTTDEWFYEQILNEFPSWLKQARDKGILL